MNKLSCICLTAGRVRHLEAAIACFLDQKCDWERELVILNTLPAQQLVLENAESHGVRIFNLEKRPSSLGEARNEAIRLSDGTHLVTWDDDDLYAPWYLQSYACRFKEGVEWVWLDKNFYSESNQIKKIGQGMANTVAFTKAAWTKAGGYSGLSVGEDRDFVGRLTRVSNGIRATLKTEEVGYLYCWGNGVYHVSGMGDDNGKRMTAWERARIHLEQQIQRRTIKTGRIVLNPSITVKPAERIAQFLGTQPAQLSGGGVCIVLLGRYGDIINALPMARLIAERYGPPAFMVSREFADVLEGVSYVTPHPVDLKYGELGRAMQLANSLFPVVLRAQVWGISHNQERQTDSYNRESWRQCGMLREFDDPRLFPDFDRRDLAREKAILAKLWDGRPLLLTKLVGGLSSPFAQAQEVATLLQSEFGESCKIIELTSLKASRVYDLLGLMDHAAALVSIDTSALHLATASGVPTVALVNSEPWLGTMPRCNCARRIPYKDALANVVAATREALAAPRRALPSLAAINPPQRTLFHAVERHEGPRDPRKEAAWKSWDALYAQGVVPCHYWNYARDARSIGDHRALPFLKDVLEFAMAQAADDDIIFLTNDDNVLHPQLPAVLRYHVAVHGACSSQRCEFRRRPVPPLTQPPSAFASLGDPHIGRDLFAFTKGWLTQHWDEIPDFILGASDWDLAMACYIRLEKGIITTRKSIETSIWPCELERGLVSHAQHVSRWSDPKNVNTAASQIWNRKLFRAWGDRHLPSLLFHEGNVI